MKEPTVTTTTPEGYTGKDLANWAFNVLGRIDIKQPKKGLSNKDYFIHLREEQQNRYEGAKQRMEASNISLSNTNNGTTENEQQ